MQRYFYGPITALSFLSSEYLFYAQGCWLILYDITHQRIINRRQVFPDGRRIFGVSNWVLSRHSKQPRFVLVFGERLVSIFYWKSLVEWQNIALVRCSDWVFDVHPIESNDDCSFLIVCAQSHHACEIYSINFETSNCQWKARINFAFEEITWSASIFIDKVTKTIAIANGCYSGNIKVFLFPVSDSWCQREEEFILLQGHAGPVFCIRWDSHGERLATTADDRCIRVWKRLTRNSFQQQIVLWDSTSRIWDLDFLPKDMIIAACEDGMSRIWNLKDGTCGIRLEDSFGKNVFCSSTFLDQHHRGDGGCLVATGSMDANCQIYRLEDILRRQADRYSAQVDLPIAEKNPRRHTNAMTLSEVNSKVSKESVKSIKWLSRDSLIIYTDQNRIYHIGIWKQQEEWKQKWTLLFHVKDKILAPISMTWIECGILMGTNCGQVLILSFLDIKRKLEDDNQVDLASRLSSHCFQATKRGAIMNIFSIQETRSSPQQLLQPNERREQIFIVAPNGCMFCYHIVWNVEEDCLVQVSLLYILRHPSSDGLFTAMCYHSTTSSVICGDKKGRIFVFFPEQQDNSECPELMPIQSLQLHSDRIHCLSWMENDMFVSASVDGMLFRNLFVHRQVKVLCQRKCFYKVATADRFLKDSDGQRLFLVGFHSKYLTIWDVLHEKEMVSMDCGGWRRAHDIWFQSNEFMICFTRRGHLVLRCECFEDIQSTPRMISDGFHGMRINHILLWTESDGKLNLISCGEDTMVRNSLFCTKSNRMQTLQILDCHISGVQCSALDEDLLWTGSGKDQLIVWQRNACSTHCNGNSGSCYYYHKKDMYFGALEKNQRLRLLNKATTVATQRITSLLVLPKDLLTRNAGFTSSYGILRSLVGATRSDGSFALQGSFENQQWMIRSLCRWKPSQFPILCSDCLILPQRFQTKWKKMLVFACNTVGQLIIWQLGEMDWQSISQVEHHVGKDMMILNNLHQGAIHDLHVSLLENDDILVITGGEDQRIKAHLFHLNTGTDQKPIILKQSFDPSYGHNASVTAVWTNGKVVFSCGADQQLILWEITFDGSNVYLQPQKTIVSNVSDISCISVADDWLVLAGYGVELVKWK